MNPIIDEDEIDEMELTEEQEKAQAILFRAKSDLEALGYDMCLFSAAKFKEYEESVGASVNACQGSFTWMVFTMQRIVEQVSGDRFTIDLTPRIDNENK